MSASVSSARVVLTKGPTGLGVGKYRYIAMLAEGGMANVYVAVTKGKPDFEKLVLIKELRPELAQDPAFVQMFVDEARLAARLNHPNVVQTLEVGADEGRQFLAMEMLEGVSYARLRRVKDGLPAPLAIDVRILADVLYGLHYAHELRDFGGAPLGVVHRDVSPANVMLTYEGGVKVLDFGIAKASLAHEQRPTDFKGKLEYMAPEQALREEVDRRADVFSVGVMLFEAIARRRFWREEKGQRIDKYARLIAGEYPTLADAKPDAPKKLVTICERALSRNREDRYTTAQDMAHELEEWLDGTAQHVSTRDIGTYVSQKFAASRARLAAAIAVQVEIFRALPEDAADAPPVKRLPLTEAPPGFDEEAQGDMRPPQKTLAGPFPASMPPLPVAAPAPKPPEVEPPAPAPAASAPMPAASVPKTPPAPAAAAQTSGAHARATPKKAPAPSGNGLFVLAGVLAVFFVIAIGGSLVYRSRRAAAMAPPASPLVTPDTTEIDLTVRVFPADARVTVDGRVETSNPVVVKRPRDGALHAIRAEAPGYVPREERFAFDRNVVVMLDLQPLVAAVPSGGTTPSPAASVDPTKKKPVPGTKPAGKGGKKPFGLDTENPY